MNHLRVSKVAAAMLLAFGASAELAQAVELGQVGTIGVSTYFNVNGSNTWYAPGKTLNDGSSNFTAYCIDPQTGVSFPNTYSVVSLDSFLNGTGTSGYAGQLGRSGYSGMGLTTGSATQTAVKNNLIELFSYAYNDSQTSAVKAAAFGAAVWEIILQDGSSNTSTNGFSKTAGRVKSYGSNNSATDSVDTQTDSYLNALNGDTWGSLGLGTATNWTYTVYYDATYQYGQSFIRVTPGGSGGSVPLPGTVALAGLGLAGVFRLRRRTNGAA